jgi:hypothetical protein
MKVSGQLHAPVALPPRERVPGTHWIGGWVSHYTHADPYPFKSKHNIIQYTEKFKEKMKDAQNHMRSVRRTLRAPSFVANIRINLALLFRRHFRWIRRSEIHMNIKVYLDATNRRRRRFYRRRTCHIYQGH